jgi:hypothetical protein
MSMRGKWIFIAPVAFAGMLALAALVVFIGGEVVQHLWNWLMPPIFGVRQITFWQAFGLLVLCRILFGGHGFSRSKSHSRTPEERERFRQAMRKRFGWGPPAHESTETPSNR